MKNLFILFILFITVKTQAQSYQISFAGTGASNKVDSVEVEDLGQCTFVTVAAKDTLHLTVATGINILKNNTENTLNVYPNPMTGYCIIDFEATEDGNTKLELYDISGKRVLYAEDYLVKGKYTYKLNGTGSGLYLLQIISDQYSYAAKIVCCNSTQGNVKIKNITANPNSGNELPASSEGAMKSLKSNKSLKDLQYKTGDTLKLQGYSGIYSTIITLVPVKNQTVTFDFIVCTDGDNNNYPIVQIGTQTWMASNLKTTKFNNGTPINNITNSTTWQNLYTSAYCWYNNSIINKNIYGGYYNWFALDTINICPTGWHVPSDSEWTVLTNYLGGVNIAGGKMKDACTFNWAYPNLNGTNSSGFTGLPAGNRDILGDFSVTGESGWFWSSTELSVTFSYLCGINFQIGKAEIEYAYKTIGFSVRCVKD